jgi:hypothetical protein
MAQAVLYLLRQSLVTVNPAKRLKIRIMALVGRCFWSNLQPLRNSLQGEKNDTVAHQSRTRRYSYPLVQRGGRLG